MSAEGGTDTHLCYGTSTASARYATTRLTPRRRRGHNGFRPCGDWFVCDTESLKHDTITFVEGAISAYVPLAGVLTNAETAERMREKQPAIGHFSGIPVGCAAGLAALEEYGRMMENVRRLKPRLHEEFSELEECNVVGDARGRGFLWCTYFVDSKTDGHVFDSLLDGGDDRIKKVIYETRDRGVLAGSGRPGFPVMVVTPLCVSEQQITKGLEALESSVVSFFG